MVYRLWAGTRLREVMRWREALVHPRAYGFRRAWGAVDAATVTQVLLELAQLKGWRLEGLSLDYVKCFDLIPQAAVLRIARELGMDDGVLRTLAAMYRQLRRAFRLAGALGAWWQATNSILQGCPLSVILINLLTTVWKMEIDTMRRSYGNAREANGRAWGRPWGCAPRAGTAAGHVGSLGKRRSPTTRRAIRRHSTRSQNRHCGIPQSVQ